MTDAPVPERLARRNRELTILHGIGETLNRAANLPEALDAALARLGELLDLETGWIWILENGATYLAAARNLPPGLAADPRSLEGGCTCLTSFHRGNLASASNIDVMQCSRLAELRDGTDGLRYHASIPLHGRSGPLGVMNVASRDWRELTPGELTLLRTVSDLVAITVERTRLFAESRRAGAAEERTRLAREIHDTLAQGLAGAAAQMETADALLEGHAGAGPARERLARALDLVRDTLEEARRSVQDLRATPLDGRSLVEALERLAREAADRGVQPRFLAAGGARPLPPHLESGLYRIAAEAMENAVRHAPGSEVIVELVTSPESVQVEVRDTGGGFDPDAVPTGRFGLTGMRERAHLLGGRLALESGPAGTTVRARVPLGNDP